MPSPLPRRTRRLELFRASLAQGVRRRRPSPLHRRVGVRELCFVTSSAVPTATGRNNQLPGRDSHPLENSALFTAHGAGQFLHWMEPGWPKWPSWPGWPWHALKHGRKPPGRKGRGHGQGQDSPCTRDRVVASAGTVVRIVSILPPPARSQGVRTPDPGNGTERRSHHPRRPQRASRPSGCCSSDRRNARAAHSRGCRRSYPSGDTHQPRWRC